MEPFKNAYSPRLISIFAQHLSKHIPDFKISEFVDPILAQLEQLELKERAQLIADHLHIALPVNPGERARILLAMLHPDESNKADQTADHKGICGWGVMPMTMVVGQHGLDDFERSLEVQKQMTKRFSSEFGVRYFILHDQERALTIFKNWINDPNHHVRRLISEGTRPRLPWAMQLPDLIIDPSPMLPILQSLRDDPSEYVRRSVANHLNDIAKDHPDLVAKLACDWMKNADATRIKLVRHACRTLIKQGNRIALSAFGLNEPQIEFRSLSIQNPDVIFDTRLEFTAIIKSTSQRPQQLIIDYLVHFKKANGKLAAKVFKWSKCTLAPDEQRILTKAHPIRPITTRRYYPGEHRLSLRINGIDYGDCQFNLIMDQQGTE